MELDKNQKRVYEWLNNDLGYSVFAEAYKGAAILIKQKSPGYISFVSHAGRDLMNRLASTVKGIESKQVNYKNHIDNLQETWQDEWRFSDDLSPEVIAEGHLIPVKVCQQISTLIEEHKSGRVRSSEADGLFFSTFLDYSDLEKIPEHFLSEWKAAKDWFLGHTHLRYKPFEVKTDDDLERHFNCLDSYLHIAATSQFERLSTLNEILDATNY